MDSPNNNNAGRTGESQFPVRVKTGGAIDEDIAVSAPFNLTAAIANLFSPRADRPGLERQTNPGAGDPGVRLVVPGEGVYALDPTATAQEPADIPGLLREIRNELRAMNRRRSSRIAAAIRRFSVTSTQSIEIVPMAYDRPAPAVVRVVDGGPIYVNAGTPATTDDWQVSATGDDFKYSADEPLYAICDPADTPADVRVWQEVTR